MAINEKQLLLDEAKYCSHGDTVHYVEHQKSLQTVKAVTSTMIKIHLT